VCVCVCVCVCVTVCVYDSLGERMRMCVDVDGNVCVYVGGVCDCVSEHMINCQSN
jgi:hypothetical protein